MSNAIEDDQTQQVNYASVKPKSVNTKIQEPVMANVTSNKSFRFSAILLSFIVGGLVVESWMQSDISLCNKNREFEVVTRSTAIAKNQKLSKSKQSRIKLLSKAVCFQKTTPLIETRKLLNKVLVGVKKS
jgi:hypothetical protein